MSNNDKNREIDRYRDRTVYTGKCDVRLTAAEDSALDRLAARNDVSRSTIMRKALADFVRFNEGRAIEEE